MISDGTIAKQISDLMLDVYRRLEESVGTVKKSCPPEEHAAYKRAVGKVVARIVFDVVEPLYEKNPALKPADWDDRSEP